MNPTRAPLAGLALAVAAPAILFAQPQFQLPTVRMYDDGTIAWGPRTIPPPSYASPEAKSAYVKLFKPRIEGRTGAAAAAPGASADPNGFTSSVAAGIQLDKKTALATFPVTVEETQIAGVPVSIYTPRDLPRANADKVGLEFVVDAEAVMTAAMARVKTISVHYRLRPAGAGNQDIVKVYREILKTHKPKKTFFFGTSGGCTFAITTAIWLKELNLPQPGALGLFTCSGGSQPGDTRVTNNGLDPLLSTVSRGRPPRLGPPPPEAPYGPDRPPATALDGAIPPGFPPAFLLTGTRDMCLSQTALLNRKLKRAKVRTELYVAEGMWHGFHGDSTLPEAREAMQYFADFLKTALA